MAQARIVAAMVRSFDASIHVEIVPMTTSGDQAKGPLADASGKGMFTTELEQALRNRQVDLAVHSMKDLPVQMAQDMAIVAVPPREDPRDSLVSVDGGGIQDLPQGATVGTGSLRRTAQLLRIRPDLKVVPLRGNVETRLSKALSSQGKSVLDAVVLAMAGLNRSGLAVEHAARVHPLAIEEFIPAAGQGALAVQALAGRGDISALARSMNHAPSSDGVYAERAILRSLDADCHSAVAVHVFTSGNTWRAIAMVARPDAGAMLRFETAASSAMPAADDMIAQMRKRGAHKLLRD